jgi:predicted aconitase
MKLTREEQEMLDGKRGDVLRNAMELLFAVGECYGAETMIPVTSVHMVPATTNVASIDAHAWREMGFSEEIHEKQEGLSGAIARMGGLLCNTCIPYLIGHAPLMRQHVAWCESSAVVYANAVLGSRTNREGGPTALAAALTGRIPAYGYHFDEHRRGTVKIVVEAPLKGPTDFATLGHFAGKVAQDRVPVFAGISPPVSRDELKYLSGAAACAGSVSHYHMVGITPEAFTEEMACGPHRIGPSNTFVFGSRELKETEESISSIGPGECELVVLGCPHASISQIGQYTRVFSGRKVKSDVEAWILTSSLFKHYAEELGYARELELAGVTLVSNTCPSPMPREFFDSKGYRGAATDSPKMAYFTSTTKGVPCFYGSLEKFVDVVTVRK